MSEIKMKSVEDNMSTAEKEQDLVDKTSGQQEDGVYKVDLTKQTEEKTVEQPPAEQVEEAKKQEEPVEQIKEEEKQVEPQEQEEVITLIKEEKDGVQVQEQGQIQEKQPEESQVLQEEVKLEYPEDVKKLMDFMSETGGTLQDYVKLNVDVESLGDDDLLLEYYKSTKPHLNSEEINFLLEDKFSYDDEIDKERDIKRKKLNYKEEVASAKTYLANAKSKYYNDIKSGSNFSTEIKEAINFYDNYKKEQNELTAQQQESNENFINKTNSVFSDKFKGFEFKVGENKFRYNVKDVQTTKEAQSNILSAFETFLDDKNMLKDANGYHKALYAARNADSIANHFYEQGKSDAIKQMSSEAKNINMDPRRIGQNIDAGGMKVRAISGDDSSKLRIKIKK
jgi:hypothetical protein